MDHIIRILPLLHYPHWPPQMMVAWVTWWWSWSQRGTAPTMAWSTPCLILPGQHQALELLLGTHILRGVCRSWSPALARARAALLEIWTRFGVGTSCWVNPLSRVEGTTRLEGLLRYCIWNKLWCSGAIVGSRCTRHAGLRGQSTIQSKPNSLFPNPWLIWRLRLTIFLPKSYQANKPTKFYL